MSDFAYVPNPGICTSIDELNQPWCWYINLAAADNDNKRRRKKRHDALEKQFALLNQGLRRRNVRKLGKQLIEECEDTGKPSMKHILPFFQLDVSLGERDHMGRTALHWAVLNSHVDLCFLLLKHGADPMAKDLYGDTVLHKVAASSKGSILLPTILKRYPKLNVNVQNKHGYTPLHWAMGRHDALNVIECLMRAGAKYRVGYYKEKDNTYLHCQDRCYIIRCEFEMTIVSTLSYRRMLPVDIVRTLLRDFLLDGADDRGTAVDDESAVGYVD
jgi:hypothetical protein